MSKTPGLFYKTYILFIIAHRSPGSYQNKSKKNQTNMC